MLLTEFLGRRSDRDVPKCSFIDNHFPFWFVDNLLRSRCGSDKPVK